LLGFASGALNRVIDELAAGAIFDFAGMANVFMQVELIAASFAYNISVIG
jgi:hypothetical protein